MREDTKLTLFLVHNSHKNSARFVCYYSCNSTYYVCIVMSLQVLIYFHSDNGCQLLLLLSSTLAFFPGGGEGSSPIHVNA